MANKICKRKIDSEYRVFNLRWANNYFFVQYKEKAACLICQRTVAVFKEYNLRRHYESRHKELTKPNASRQTLTAKNWTVSSAEHICTQTQVNQSAVRASFWIAQLIASSGKPFIDGEFVKKCMNAVVEEVCPKKMYLIP